MDRRHFLKAMGLAGTAVGLGAWPTWAQAADTLQLTVLHTNDMHSRVDPFPAEASRNAGMGGLARRAALVKQIRAEGNHVLLLDAGDVFQGTAYFNFFGGEVEYKLMTQMGYDATTLGNHDFDAGLDGLAKQLPAAGFDFLSANYRFEQPDLKARVKPYRIFERGPLRIGVFGLGIRLEGLVLENLYGKTQYLDPIGTAKEMVQELRRQGCHLIICLSHLGNAYDDPTRISDKILAESVDGIDLVIGGHTHTFLPKPLEYQSKDGHKVLVNQVGWAGINLGRIDFFFSKGLKKQAAQGQALAIG
jgi:5'-nucleotidase